MNCDDISFHDSSIESICQEKDKIVIHISDVVCVDRSKSSCKTNCKVIIKRVSSIAIDQVYVDALNIRETDGEILELSVKKGKVEILIEWKDFVLKKNTIKFYEIEGETVECLSE